MALVQLPCEGEGHARRRCCAAGMCEGETHVQAPGRRCCCICRAREKAEARALLLWGCAREMAAGRAALLGGRAVLVVVPAKEGAERRRRCCGARRATRAEAKPAQRGSKVWRRR